jgi:hypothetical protein
MVPRLYHFPQTGEAMIFKVIDRGREQTYEGFRPADFACRRLALGELKLAMCFLEGMTEAWYLDSKNPLALGELQRYYREQEFEVRIEVWGGMAQSVTNELLPAEPNQYPEPPDYRVA